MALTNDDILVVQSNDNGGLYKVSVRDLNAGALTLISESAPDTDAYEAGTLWFNSKETEANLYVLYADEDPAGGKKWVQTSGTGGGSGGGGDTSTPTLIIDGTGGAPSPDPYDAGTLWYNSSETDGSLYILYVDAAPDAGKKWVEIASGTGGGSSNNGSGFSGDYNDLTNKPDIPGNTSDLTNDSGFITASDVPEGFSGDYNDLTNKPDNVYVELSGDATAQEITGTGGLKTAGLLESAGGVKVSGGSFTLNSPDGTAYNIEVDNNGVITTSPAVF